MQEHYDLPIHGEAVPFIDITERAGEILLRNRLIQSKGKALVLVHSFFVHEQRYVDNLRDKGQKAEMRSKLDAHCRESVRLMHEFSAHGLPIIMFLEADEQEGFEEGLKNRPTMHKLLENTAKALRTYGFHGKKIVYFIPTMAFDPAPLGTELTDSQRQKIADTLYASGLKYAYVGGAYFNYSLLTPYHGVTPNTDVGLLKANKRMARERKNGIPIPPHPLEKVDVHNCVGTMVKAFAYAGTDVSMVRATYPSKLPSRRLLK